MSTRHTTDNPDHQDPRTNAIGEVWGIAVGVLVVCIPLCLILKSAILPIMVVAGTVLVSLYIWSSGASNKANKAAAAEADAEAEQLRAKIRELEERLANVETLNTFEERLAERTIARQEEEEEQQQMTTRETEPPV